MTGRAQCSLPAIFMSAREPDSILATRTGEPGELQGKKKWLLPMWFVLFPYNMFAALCWCAVCRVFNVRGAPPPPEAFGR